MVPTVEVRSPFYETAQLALAPEGEPQSDPASFDIVSDFSATAAAPGGTGVFRYGYTTSLGSPFAPYAATIAQAAPGMDKFYDGVNDVPAVHRNTTAGAVSYVGTVTQPADMLNLHPGPAGQYCVVRFIVPASGTYRLSGAFKGLDFGYEQTSTDVGVLVNADASKPLVGGKVVGFGATHTFDTTVPLTGGDTLDFFVGFGGDNYYDDSTGLRAVISRL